MSEGQKKSGIKSYAPGDVLFHNGDNANSLFIIQKGQVRLYLPKGRGFVELAILRAGEVIGEMAYFDESASRRSCSASALVSTEVIEISFQAFGKTMSALNPWFKTIIHTLADRLRKTNDKVRELESNSLVYGKQGKVSEYEFFHKSDILKLLSLLYLGMKTHAEYKDTYYELHAKRLKFYMLDIFSVSEVKFEQFFLMMEEAGFLKLVPDEDKLPKLIQMSDIESIRSIMVFMNMQRMVDDKKKIVISPSCEILLSKIMREVVIKRPEEDSFVVDLSSILEECEKEGNKLTESHLLDATQSGICAEVMVGGENKLTVEVFHKTLKKLLPPVRLMNAIQRVNEAKVDQS
jgi:CRP-like cAMP-binding protein